MPNDARLLTGWGITAEIPDVGELPIKSFTGPNRENPSSNYQYYNPGDGVTMNQHGASSQPPASGTATFVGPVPPADKAQKLQEWHDKCMADPNGLEENKKTITVTVMEGEDPVHTYNLVDCHCADLTYSALTAGDVSVYEYTLVVQPTTHTIEF
jgi:hypothetical protein